MNEARGLRLPLSVCHMSLEPGCTANRGENAASETVRERWRLAAGVGQRVGPGALRGLAQLICALLFGVL